MAVVTLNGNEGLIDEHGNEVVIPKYESVSVYENALVVGLNGRFGLIDRKGNELVPPKYDVISRKPQSDLAAVKSNGKYGLIDLAGKELIPAKYEYLSSNANGLVAVEKGPNRFYIDREDTRRYDAVHDGEGVSCVEIRGKGNVRLIGFVNEVGEETGPLREYEQGWSKFSKASWRSREMAYGVLLIPLARKLFR